MKSLLKKNNYTKIEIAPSQKETASLESNENVSALLSQNSSKAIEEIQPPLPKIKTADNLPSAGKPFIWDEMNLNMPWIPPGEFTMHTRNGLKIDQSFSQTIRFPSGFWMSKFEITQFTFFKIMKKKSFFKSQAE